MRLTGGAFGHATIEGAGLVEHRGEIAQVGSASRLPEMTVPVDELLKGIEQRQAPAGIRPAAHALATYIHVDRRGMRQH